MKVGIVGCGSIGSRHARTAAQDGHDVFVCDADHGRAAGLAHELGLIGWSDKITKEFAATADALLVCTPAGLHARTATDLRRAGYTGPLFVEKPLALNTLECGVFRDWPHATTMVGYNWRFHELIRMLRQEARPLLRGELRIRCDMRTWPGIAYGPALLECSHELDLALALGASPVVRRAALWGSGGLIDLGDWTVEVEAAASDYERYWAIEFSEARISQRVTDPGLPEVAETYRTELRHFLAHAACAQETLTPFADGIRVLEVVQQAERLSPAGRA